MKKQKFTNTTAFASEGTMLPGSLGAMHLATSGAQTTLDRTVLPTHETQYPHSTVLDVRKATPLPRDGITHRADLVSVA